MTIYMFEEDWYHGMIHQFTSNCERLGVSADAECRATAHLIGSAMIAQAIDKAGKDLTESINDAATTAYDIHRESL